MSRERGLNNRKRDGKNRIYIIKIKRKQAKMYIRCRKTTCEFNNNHTCMAKEISIGENICCSSYKLAEELSGTPNNKQGKEKSQKVGDNTKNLSDKEVSKLKKDDYSKKMFKKEQKNAPFRNRKTINIDCKANCLFNNNGVCRANGITVNDTQTEKPVCMGYLEK